MDSRPGWLLCIKSMNLTKMESLGCRFVIRHFKRGEKLRKLHKTESPFIRITHSFQSGFMQMSLMSLGRRSADHNEGNKRIFTHSEEQWVFADPLDGSHQIAFQRNLCVLSASQQHAVLTRNKEPEQ